MKLIESILYIHLIKNKKFIKDQSVLEVCSFFQGVMLGESRYVKFDEICEATWIVKFEEFITYYLNSELNNFNEEWTETIGTTYSKWIYRNQKNDEDGLGKFYRIFDLFIQSIDEDCLDL